MKIERGRKKNQLIWSFILKVIAGQSLVKTLFLNKTRKENDSEEKYAFAVEETHSGVMRFHLNRERTATRVTDSGSRGPTGQV